MPYAVDVAGLTTVRARDDFVLKMLLAEVVDLDGPTVECKRDKFAGVGVLLRCDEERAEAIVKLIRRKYEHWELPIYYSKSGSGGWAYVK